MNTNSNSNIFYKEKTETTITKDENGTVISETEKRTTQKTSRSEEPDYIKIYTRMWCEFNQIPMYARDLFMEIVMRMSYADPDATEGGQLVYLIAPANEDIMKKLHIKKAMYQRALKALCDCHAIRKISRGVYQVSPLYAGKGSWKYNPKLQTGGVEDLVAKFSFKEGTVETQILWGDDGEDTPTNTLYRKVTDDAKPKDETVLKETSITLPPANDPADNEEKDIIPPLPTSDLLKKC